jgi:hypothetical protein
MYDFFRWNPSLQAMEEPIKKSGGKNAAAKNSTTRVGNWMV